MRKQTSGSEDGTPAPTGVPLGEHGKRLLYRGLREKVKSVFIRGYVKEGFGNGHVSLWGPVGGSFTGGIGIQ